MKTIMLALVFALVSVVTAAGPDQNFDPAMDIDIPRFKMIEARVEQPGLPGVFRPAFVIDPSRSVPPPNNSQHIANFDAQCLTGGKSCKVPVQLWILNADPVPAAGGLR